MRRWVGLCGGVVLLLYASAASAQWRPGLSPEARARARAEPREAGPKPKYQRVWYGHPILLADGLSYGLLLLTAEHDVVADQTVPLAVVNWLLTPSLIHFGMGNWAQAVADVPLRLGLPFGGVLLGAVATCRSRSDCEDGVASGLVLGMLAATAVDVSLFAFEKVEAPSARVQPTLRLSRSHALLGAVAAF